MDSDNSTPFESKAASLQRGYSDDISCGASKENVAAPKRSPAGMLLEPQPSDRKEDPLNWSLGRKISILLIVSFAAMAGGAVGMCNLFSFNVLASVYNKTPIQVSHSAAANAAGIATGPLLWVPLSNKFGRPSVIFWNQLAALGMCIWSSQMTGSNDFVPFILSRWLAGTFSSAAFTLGGGVIIDIFFLHQRGKAYATYVAFFILGAYLGATSSGFIIQTEPWPVQFYWVIAVVGLSAILLFCFMEDTTFDRELLTSKAVECLSVKSFLANRVSTFFPGHKMVAPSKIYKGPFDAILIGVQPVTIISGLFIMITFGWAVPAQTLIGVFIQIPKPYGGYGFNGTETACFSFVSWVSITFAEMYGLLLNDRVPLWTCKRNGGVWRPEFRLYPLLLPPLILLPFALGLYGATLEYGLSYWALAVAFFFISFADSILLPVITNYISECFVHHSSEVFVIVNFYRFILGATIMFFFEDWSHAVGMGWAFGMMGLFAILGFIGTLCMWWYGPMLRRATFVKRLASSEDDSKLFSGSGDH